MFYSRYSTYSRYLYPNVLQQVFYYSTLPYSDNRKPRLTNIVSITSFCHCQIIVHPYTTDYMPGSLLHYMPGSRFSIKRHLLPFFRESVTSFFSRLCHLCSQINLTVLVGTVVSTQYSAAVLSDICCSPVIVLLCCNAPCNVSCGRQTVGNAPCNVVIP